MNKEIRVLHVSTATGWRGGEQQIAYLLLGRKKDSVITNFVFGVKDQPVDLFCKANNIPFEPYGKKAPLSLSNAKQFSVFCKKNAIDIVHTHDSHGHTMAILAADIFNNSPKIVVHRRVDFPQKGVLATYKYNHKKIAQYIPISNAIKTILEQTIVPKNQHKISLVYSTIALDKFKNVNKVNIREEVGLAQNTILVGNISALVDHKDYPTFLKTAQRIIAHSSRYHFIILGTGELLEELISLAKELGIFNHVHFLGFKTNAISYIKDFDVFLMPSKLEGLGTSVLEAFACEIPVVGTNAGGLKETIINELTGLSAPVGNVEQLSNHVIRLQQEPELAKQMVTNAKQMVVQDFSSEKMVNEITSIYKKIFYK